MLPIVILAIGAAILIAGLYYRRQAGNNPESHRLCGILCSRFV